MIGRTNAGGGGGGLNFKVVGGSAQPENLKENTIWVNTDAEITSWSFSVTEPESPTEGMVWISTGTSSPVEFNALKKQGIQVYPISAKQYIGESWANKSAYIYHGASWVQFSFAFLYLYNTGDECTSVTGGWSAKAITYDIGGVTPTLTKGSSSIKVTIAGQDWACGVCVVNNSIDITPYKKLKINITAKTLSPYDSMKKFNSFSVLSDLSSGYNKISSVQLVDCIIGTNTIDVSSINGEKYIAICMMGDSDNVQSVTFNKVWLE